MERIVNAIHQYLDAKEKEEIKRLQTETSQLRLQQHFTEMFSEKVIGIKKKNCVLKECPFCKKSAVFVGVHDDEGNYHGNLGCEYEQNPWSGLSYALHHEGWGDCILCTDDAEQTMGGVLFDTAEEAIQAWNNGLIK